MRCETMLKQAAISLVLLLPGAALAQPTGSVSLYGTVFAYNNGELVQEIGGPSIWKRVYETGKNDPANMTIGAWSANSGNGDSDGLFGLASLSFSSSSSGSISVYANQVRNCTINGCTVTENVPAKFRFNSYSEIWSKNDNELTVSFVVTDQNIDVSFPVTAVYHKLP